MDDQKISCFLPCRKGSQRIPRKNIKPFAGHQYGLTEIKLKQVLDSNEIDEVVLSTNDEEILGYAQNLRHPKLRIHKRSDSLASSETSTDDLVAHALDLIPQGHIMWTHVTSPFINTNLYNGIIQCYRTQLKAGHDSLMTTTAIRSFLWNDEGPINYNREAEKWPRTQTLPKIHEINSGAFIASAEIYRKLDDRIGHSPYLYELDKLVSQDIDWPEDFLVAECLVQKGLVSL